MKEALTCKFVCDTTQNKTTSNCEFQNNCELEQEGREKGPVKKERSREKKERARAEKAEEIYGSEKKTLTSVTHEKRALNFVETFYPLKYNSATAFFFPCTLCQ